MLTFGAALPLVASADPRAVRAYARALEDAGFDFVGVGGHVLGQPAGTHEARPAVTYTGPFHDPFVLFGYLAAVTERLHFQTAILILPALPTALVAKQAAELHAISGGRFHLGVGISWNEAEYQALGAEIRGRAARLEEQVEVLRRLWAEPYVDFRGQHHHLQAVGLNAVQAIPIPIWFGTGFDENPMRRVARLADGWMPLGDPVDAMPRMRQYLDEAGRPAESLMVRANIAAGDGGRDEWLAAAGRLQAAGVSHVTISAPSRLVGDAGLERLAAAREAIASEFG